MTDTPLLALSGLTKAYPGVVANDDVSLRIAPGEVHALLGENGAGKSTLVKMIYGLVKPDSGKMEMNGSAYTPQEPRDRWPPTGSLATYPQANANGSRLFDVCCKTPSC